MHRSIFLSFRWLLLVLSLIAIACDLGDATALFGGSSKPMVVITSPPSGSQYHEGDEVAIQSASSDATGVVRVDLIVDGTIVHSDMPPDPQTHFTVFQAWKALPGVHAITVRAYNATGVRSDPAEISVSVSTGASPAGTSPSGTAVAPPNNSPVGAPTQLQPTSVLGLTAVPLQLTATRTLVSPTGPTSVPRSPTPVGPTLVPKPPTLVGPSPVPGPPTSVGPSPVPGPPTSVGPSPVPGSPTSVGPSPVQKPTPVN